VPGLAAKPIIDIQVSVEHVHPLEPWRAALATLGYVHAPHPDDARCPFFHRPDQWPHTFHVHLVEAGGDEERRTLAFRDYLRTHPAAARQYEGLKLRLRSQHTGATPASREAYADAKGEFVERAIARGLAGE
jgi:GrpB-like predicted nucleotidyltransferase (UPF0157 family)